MAEAFQACRAASQSISAASNGGRGSQEAADARSPRRRAIRRRHSAVDEGRGGRVVARHILNRSELCECSLTAGNYLLSCTNINCGNVPEARDGYFTTYYSFNKIVLDVITEKFNIQVDENTRNQATLLHDDIPGYDLPTIDFVNKTIDQDKDVSILEEDNSQIYAHLDNVLVHMIDKQQTAIF